MKIKILSNDTINKIAAGEVIERPASVVKELVENSIDAGATQVDIEIKAGGKTLIRVTDNGCGMNKDDAALAFERHATSKIDSADDLSRINTLGFRGEALPSIAAISMVEMITKTREIQSATRIKIDGGKMLEVKEQGAPCGTAITMKNLFFNTPARRKFLKSTATELSHIVDVVSNYSIVYPNCGFTLEHNDETLIEIMSKDSLLDRIRLLYGNETAESGTPVEKERDGIKVRGIVCKPSVSYNNRSRQFVFVNKRPVSNRAISYAIYESYNTLIPKGRFPAVFLFLEVPAESMDVNVHPAKKEVKFENERIIQEIVKESVINALGIKDNPPQEAQIVSGRFFKEEKAQEEYGSTPSFSGRFAEGVMDFIPQREQEQAGGRFFQVNNAYIINEKEDGFLIIDQHAMHERVLYEKIKTGFGNKKQESQRLLMPVNVELTVSEEKILKKKLPLLNELGFGIEEFGNHSVIVDMVPQIFDKTDIACLIKDIVNGIKDMEDERTSAKEKSPSEKDIEDGIIKMMACKAAVKQGDKLESAEILKLLRDWQKLDLQYTCPHGRPAAIKMTRAELDKKFKRT